MVQHKRYVSAFLRYLNTPSSSFILFKHQFHEMCGLVQNQTIAVSYQPNIFINFSRPLRYQVTYILGINVVLVTILAKLRLLPHPAKQETLQLNPAQACCHQSKHDFHYCFQKTGLLCKNSIHITLSQSSWQTSTKLTEQGGKKER